MLLPGLGPRHAAPRRTLRRQEVQSEGQVLPRAGVNSACALCAGVQCGRPRAQPQLRPPQLRQARVPARQLPAGRGHGGEVRPPAGGVPQPRQLRPVRDEAGQEVNPVELATSLREVSHAY